MFKTKTHELMRKNTEFTFIQCLLYMYKLYSHLTLKATQEEGDILIFIL